MPSEPGILQYQAVSGVKLSHPDLTGGNLT
jgi:hypothetical protein